MLKQLLIAALAAVATLAAAGFYIQASVNGNDHLECTAQVNLAVINLCFGSQQLREGYWFYCENETPLLGFPAQRCGPMDMTHSVPAIVAVGDAGSTAAQTGEAACHYFAHVGWECLALDSMPAANAPMDDTLARVNAAVDYLKRNESVDSSRVMLWGGGEGALAVITAASLRGDVYAVAATSPPLPGSTDAGRSRLAAIEGMLKTNLVYVFGEHDAETDQAAADALVSAARANGKQAESIAVPNAGHAVCCGDGRPLELEFDWLNGIMGKQE